MYELTASETATILSVLCRRAGPEGEEAELRGVPASTFYATRRKLYDSGWVVDRFVPNPWAIGVSSVEFAVLTPELSARAVVESNLAASPSTVVLWSGLNSIFAVSFNSTERSPERAGDQSIRVLPNGGSIPVYFDYSRAWSRFVGLERETGYPRALGDSLATGERAPLSTVRELLDEAAGGAEGGHRGRPWHPGTLPSRSQQRLVDKGIIQSRTLLNTDRIPPFDGRALGEAVFLTGELREGVRPNQVLASLHNDCGVSPVVMSEDGVNVLIVGLGQLAADAARRTKIPRANAHVARALDSVFKKVRMVVERIDSLRVEVNHRYDRLLGGLRASN